MIFSSIYANDNTKCYPDAIRKAIDYVTKTDFSKLEDGRQEIDGDNLFAKVFHLTSKQVEETHLELHKQYVDVQFWLNGEELCGVAPYTGEGVCVEANVQEDLYFYKDIGNEFFIHATKGCYAVFFPNDAHRPGICIDGQPLDYRKVVVKVSVDLL